MIGMGAGLNILGRGGLLQRGQVVVDLPFQTGQTLTIALNDYMITTLLGVFQMGMGLLLFTLGSRVLPAAKLTLLSLSEVFFAPLWVWIFLGEEVSGQTLMGGGVLVLAIVWNIVVDQRLVISTGK